MALDSTPETSAMRLRQMAFELLASKIGVHRSNIFTKPSIAAKVRGFTFKAYAVRREVVSSVPPD
jgi:hypothetical protein